MNKSEIKNAWNTMKKEIKKELGESYSYGFTMTTSQAEKGTATKYISIDRKESYKRAEVIARSKAFQKFSGLVGGCTYKMETDSDGFFRMRFSYKVEA